MDPKSIVASQVASIVVEFERLLMPAMENTEKHPTIGGLVQDVIKSLGLEDGDKSFIQMLVGRYIKARGDMLVKPGKGGGVCWLPKEPAATTVIAEPVSPQQEEPLKEAV